MNSSADLLQVLRNPLDQVYRQIIRLAFTPRCFHCILSSKFLANLTFQFVIFVSVEAINTIAIPKHHSCVKQIGNVFVYPQFHITYLGVPINEAMTRVTDFDLKGECSFGEPALQLQLWIQDYLIQFCHSFPNSEVMSLSCFENHEMSTYQHVLVLHGS